MVRKAAGRARRELLRGGLALAGVGLLAGCGVAPPWVPAPAKVRRIGLLAHPDVPEPWIDSFRAGLGARGWDEGRTYVIERRFSEGRQERLPELAAELIGMPVDVIVARAAQPALAAKQLTDAIPIVAVGVGDPVGEGLVANQNRPGGNVTALMSQPPEIVAKCLELLKESFPAIARVAVLFNPTIRGAARQWQLVQEAAPLLGLTLEPVVVADPSDIEAAFAATGAGADGLLAIHDPVLLPHAARITALAAGSRLPAIYQFRPYVADAGGLMSYELDPGDIYARAADYVDRILNGANAGDLPVERPSRFKFVVNLKTARAIGLTVPPSVLAQATEIIE